MKVSAMLQMAGAFAIFFSCPAVAWQPSTFQFYCGSPAFSGMTLLEEAQMALLSKPFEPTYVALVLLSNPVAAARWETMMGSEEEAFAPRADVLISS